MREVIEANSIPEPNSGCWLWERAVSPEGYGQIRRNGQLLRAHRVSYATFNGELSQGLHVLHRCDNPYCVNPTHLFLGTRSENMQDCARKGRCNRATPEFRNAHHAALARGGRIGATGFRGVHKHGKKYRAQVSIGNKTVRIGSFDTPDAAYNALLEYENRNGLTQ